jgi:hypothetical protein
LADDTAAEGHTPDSTVVVNGLNETAIKAWWGKWTSAGHGWPSLWNNCAEVTKKALNHGASAFNPEYLNPANAHPIWTPSDVEKYAKDLRDWEASKAAGTLDASQYIFMLTVVSPLEIPCGQIENVEHDISALWHAVVGWP